MENLISISFLPAQANKWIDSQTVLKELHTRCVQRSLPDLAPYRIIIAPCTLPLSIADALLDSAKEVMVETEDVNSSSRVDVAAKLQEKGQLGKLKPLQSYCEGLPPGQSALAVLSTGCVGKKLANTKIKFGFAWPYSVLSSTATEITVTQPPKLRAQRSNYAADDLLARLQLRGIKEAEAALQTKEEEWKQRDLGLDSTITAIRKLPSQLPVPASFTLPPPPQSQPVQIANLQQSTDDLLSSLRRLKSAIHSST